MAAAPLTLERARAIDDPFRDFDDWADALQFGICTACGSEAYAGRTGWFHDGTVECLKRDVLTPSFAADE